MTEPAVEMCAIDKAFGPVKALERANLVVMPGSLHGLVGQNGAGKSTIIKVLAGIYQRDSGSVRVFGKDLVSISPASVEQEGVYFIHQDRLLVPTSTVAEAIFLGDEPRLGPFINYRAMNRMAAELVEQYFSVEIDPRSLVRDLSTARQKIVQITRALARKARVLVLDEPTAALVQREVESLFTVLRRLRDDGIAVVFISHYIQEVLDICDEVTVLRNGADVGVLKSAETNIDEVVALMTNRETSEMYPRRTVGIGEKLLEVENLTLTGHFENVTFSAHAGEILGLTGLLGSGDKEVLECLFGLQRPDSGSIRIRGQSEVFRVPRDAVDAGIAMIPEDRRAHGVAVNLSVSENISIPSIGRLSLRGFVNTGQEAEIVNGLITDLGILTPDGRAQVKSLSGGNQQKVVVAKWLGCHSRVYLLDEPTVAIDVGAKVEIYNLMNRLAGEGAALVFLTSDLDEITEICDRILVIHRGRLTHEFQRGEVDGERLMAAASGARNLPTAAP